jgi:pSer/pThr/pTyr-binding forkhead associated (FHA) protein
MINEALSFAGNHGLVTHEPEDYQDQATTVDQSLKSMNQPIIRNSKVEALIELESLSLHPLLESVIEIGRGEGSQIRLKDPVVSRHHARIHVYEGCLILFDLESTNGTYVNGKRVIGGLLLFGGDKVTIGLSEFIVAA